MRRRTRLILITIAASLAVVIVIVVAGVYLLLQPERFTQLLRSEASKAGLTLTLSSPAEPDLWPRPAVVLHGLTVSVANRPVLVAARARLVLPWSTLFGGPPAITRLKLDAPRINLAQLGPALAHMKPGKSGPPTLPHIDAGVRVSHGILVRGNNVLLDNIHLVTGPLTPGHVFHAQLSADTAHGHAIKLVLRMTPHVGNGVVRLDNLHLQASGPSDLACVLDGQARWRGGSNIALNLAGTLTRSGQRHYDVQLALDHASTQKPLFLDLSLNGPGLAAKAHISPTQLVDWWRKVSNAQTLTNLPLPPLNGSMSAKKITIGDMHIEGLHVSAGKPAAASTAAKP